MEKAVSGSISLISFNEETKDKISESLKCSVVDIIPQSVINSENSRKASNFSLRKKLVNHIR